MRVEVSGKQFVFPPQCACCGRFAGTQLRLTGTERNRRSLTKGWAWGIPYCHRCLGHVKTSDRILVGWLTAVTVAGLLAFIAHATGVPMSLAIAVFASVALSSSLASWMGIRRIKLAIYPECTTLSRAATYLGSTGSWHSFEFKSKTYCTEFVRANRFKLVNASASVASLAKDLDPSRFQVGKRITKRFQ